MVYEFHDAFFIMLAFFVLQPIENITERVFVYPILFRNALALNKFWTKHNSLKAAWIDPRASQAWADYVNYLTITKTLVVPWDTSGNLGPKEIESLYDTHHSRKTNRRKSQCRQKLQQPFLQLNMKHKNFL